MDPGRLAVGGASAGWGLASLALLARDRGEVDLSFQLLVNPMLGDRNEAPSSDEITDARVWNRRANLFGWRSYVGEGVRGENVPPYAAAAWAADLGGLPPVYVSVGAQDLFLDEDVEYARSRARQRPEPLAGGRRRVSRRTFPRRRCTLRTRLGTVCYETRPGRPLGYDRSGRRPPCRGTLPRSQR